MANIYLAGPMTGVAYFNYPLFHRVTALLRAEGHEVFNPAEADIARLGKDPSMGNPVGDVEQAMRDCGFDRRKALQDDFRYILYRADEIAMLPGWERGRGARAEWQTADALDLKIRYL